MNPYDNKWQLQMLRLYICFSHMPYKQGKHTHFTLVRPAIVSTHEESSDFWHFFPCDKFIVYKHLIVPFSQRNGCSGASQFIVCRIPLVGPPKTVQNLHRTRFIKTHQNSSMCFHQHESDLGKGLFMKSRTIYKRRYIV